MQELAVYFTNGTTAYFKKVENFEEIETEIRFDYFG